MGRPAHDLDTLRLPLRCSAPRAGGRGFGGFSYGERVPEGAEERFRRSSRWLAEDALGIGVRGGHGRLMMVPPAKRGSRTAGRHAAELPALRRVLATGRPESEGLRWRVAVETLLPGYFVLLARSSRGGGHFSIRGGKESLLSAPLFPRHTRRFRASPRDPAARGAGSRLPTGLCSSAAVPPWLTGPAGPHAAFVRVGFRLDSACRWLCWQ